MAGSAMSVPSRRWIGGRGRANATGLLGLALLCAACDGDGAEAADGARDAATPVLDGAAPDDAAAAPDAAHGDERDAAPVGCPAPDASVGDAPGQGVLEALMIEVPLEPPVGLPFMVAVSTASGAPLSADVALCVEGEVVAVLHLYRGRGSAPLALSSEGPVTITASTASAFGQRRVRASARPREQVTGALSGSSSSWDRTADIVVRGDAIVPAGSTLTIEAGTRVLLEANAALEVHGVLRVRGNADDPVLFTRASKDAWGGVRVLPDGRAELEHAWFTAGGGDATRAFGHSDSQPVVYVEAGTLVMSGGGVVDSPGKAFGGTGSRVTIDGALVSRCDTGGQLNASEVLLQNAHVLEMPDADGRFDDDDNDGLYLSGAQLDADGNPIESIIRDTVFARGEDDGIDHNKAQLRVERVWIEGFRHEGIAGSNGNRLLVRDSVIRDCEQGIEAGYGAPEVIVDHCLLIGNDVGLRFGDSYDDETTGSLTVRHTISLGNRTANVRNHVSMLDGPLAGALRVECSMVGSPESTAESGNVVGKPEGDWALRGCATGPDMRAPGCDGTPPGPRTCF